MKIRFYILEDSWSKGKKDYSIWDLFIAYLNGDLIKIMVH